MSEIAAPFVLTFDDQDDYLRVRVEADAAKFETVLAYWTTIIAECRKRNQRRLFVERNVPGRLSPGEMFNLATSLAAMRIENIKIALFDPEPSNYDANRFAELAGSNRGAWGKVFTSAAEAEKWLVSDDGHQ